MALDFPSAPTVGQKYPATPVAGVPTYTWDGAKWTTIGAPISGKTPVYTDGSNAMTAALTLAGNPINPTDAADKNYVDTKALALSGGQTITGGFAVAPHALPSGSFTLNPLLGNYQYITNNGAFSIAPPTVDCAVDLLITNGPNAGTISMTGFVVGSNYGDPYTTTNGSMFIFSMRRINGVSTVVFKALQ